jgi:hypothetical protein
MLRPELGWPRLRARRDGLIVRDIGAETIVYDRRSHRAHCLGLTAAAIWRQWDGRSGLAEVARRTSLALGETLDEASVRRTLRRLERAGLIEGIASRSDSRGGAPPEPGRRAALRSVGVAAGLAVLSVATQSPAQAAATCLALGQPCSGSSQCCSRCCNPNADRCVAGGLCAPP